MTEQWTPHDLADLAEYIREGWLRVSGRRPTEESARLAAEHALATWPYDARDALDACRAFDRHGGPQNEKRANRELSTLLLLLEERFVFEYEEE